MQPAFPELMSASPEEVPKKSKLEEMDAKLQQVLKGEDSVKKKNEDRLRTETGEELLYAEFAPGMFYMHGTLALEVYGCT